VSVDRCDFTIQFAWSEAPMENHVEELENQKKPEAEKPLAKAGP